MKIEFFYFEDYPSYYRLFVFEIWSRSAQSDRRVTQNTF